MDNTYELKPIYTNQKSFYGKALVKGTNDEGLVLYSYNTKVAQKNKQVLKVTHNKNYLSSTTLKHIKEFMQQLGYSKMSKNEILNEFEVL